MWRPAKDLVAIYVLTAIMTVYAIILMIGVREVQQSQIDREKFAAYMKCLIVPDEKLYEELGRQKYVEFCEKHLRGS